MQVWCWKAWLGLAASALVLYGCGSSSTNSSHAASNAASSKSSVPLTWSTPAGSGTLKSITWDLPLGEPPTLDPVKSGDYSSQMVMANLCDSLFRMNPQWIEEPSLATSYRYANPKTLILNIRQGVKFWDGHPLTASDVVFSLDRNMNPKTGSINEANYSRVSNITQTGPYQVTVHFKQPDESFLHELGDEIGSVEEKAYIEKVGNQAFGSAKGGMMCSGPYELKSWTPGQSIVLVKNPHYWDPALEPKIDTVKLLFVTDSSALTSGLISGQIDGTYEAPISNIPALRNASTGSLYFGPSLQTFALWPSQPTGPADNVNVRRALSMVIDRSAIASKIMYGAGAPSLSVEPNTSWTPATARSIYAAGYDKLPGATPDVAAAKKLVDQVPQASRTMVLGLTAGDQVETNIASAIQSEAAQAGLHVQLKELSPLDFSNALYVPSARKGIDFLLAANYLLIPDELDDLPFWVYPKSLLNFTNYDNPTVANLVSEARSSLNPQQRAQDLVQAQALYMKDDERIPVATLDEVSFINKRLTGETTSFAYLFEPSLAYLSAK